MLKKSFAILVTGLVLAAAFSLPAAEVVGPLVLWPNGAPGEKGNIGEENNTPVTGARPIILTKDVSSPTITVYKPDPAKDSGTAVVVCPGGAYNVLAWDLEGTEVIDWLNSIGVTGVLLKYRVPRREGREKHEAPLEDVQRALGLVRQHADRWGIDPKRVGVLGFSAGGHLAATVSNTYSQRVYTPVDAADQQSCRPDFTVLIYPAYLTQKDPVKGYMLAPEIKVTKDTPPAIMIQTEDDSVLVESAIYYFLALRNAKVPGELHAYAKGGHGYGLRPSENQVSHWPELVATWMNGMGLLKK